jgi:hypothetical protein
MGVSKDSDASSIILEEQLLNAFLLLANFLHSKTPTKDRNVYLQLEGLVKLKAGGDIPTG